jgi:hypothetical protein
MCIFSICLCDFNGFNSFNSFNMYIVAWYGYQYPKTECYKRCEKFVQLVSITLWRHFVHIFYHLYKIRETKEVNPNEGVSPNKGYMGHHYLLKFLSHVTITTMFTVI